MNRQIEVSVILPSDVEPNQREDVRVQVEDVSEADAPAKVIAESVLKNAALVPGGRLKAVVKVEEAAIHPKARYSVRVRSDHYISTQSHPVLTQGRPNEVVIPLKRIG